MPRGTSYSKLQITIDHVSYSLSEIINNSFVAKDKFEKNILEFCKFWMSEEKKFSTTTSGSTGVPKTIILTRAQMVAGALAVKKVVSLKRGDTALICLDSQHIACQIMLVRSLVFGMNIYTIKPTANPLAEIPEHVHIDVAAFVPYQMHAIFESKNQKKLEDMRYILVGGAPISLYLKRKITALASCHVYATYGMTETAAAIALKRLNGNQAQQYFHALPGIFLSQTDDGCLVISSKHFKVVTHDIVEIKKKGSFEWLGRKDNIINSGGIKIVPETVEETIQNVFTLLRVARCFFVIGLPDEQLGKKVCLIVEGGALNASAQNNLMEEIKKILPPYAMPKEIRFISQFTKTQSGKVCRIKTALHI